MAVARVFGQVDGVEIVLEPKEGNRWEVPVPFDEDGEYAVEILAEDEAGNRAYMAKMLFVVNTAQLCVHMIPMPFYGKLLADRRYTATLRPKHYYGELILPECGGGSNAENKVFTGRRKTCAHPDSFHEWGAFCYPESII